MRRGASIVVLAVLLAALLAPLTQGTASSLPACCRANGAHHCMGMAGRDGFHSQAQSCPFRSYPAVVGGVVALVGRRSSLPLPATQSQSVMAATTEPVRLPFDTVQKRGPPSLG